MKKSNSTNKDYVYIYHGTTRDRLPGIMKEGLKVMPTARHLPNERKPHTVHLTTSKNEAIRYAQQSFKKHKYYHNLGMSELDYVTGRSEDSANSGTYFHPRIATPSERKKAVLLRVKISKKEFNERKSGQLPGDAANMVGFKRRKLATQVEYQKIQPSRIQVLDVKKESFPFFKI